MHSLNLAICDFGSYFKSCKSTLRKLLSYFNGITWESTTYFCQQYYSKNVLLINSFFVILLMKPAFNLTSRSQSTTNKMWHFTFFLYLKVQLKNNVDCSKNLVWNTLPTESHTYRVFKAFETYSWDDIYLTSYFSTSIKLMIISVGNYNTTTLFIKEENSSTIQFE